MALCRCRRACQPAGLSGAGAPHPSPSFTYIRGQQLLGIVDAGHQDLTLADEGVVVRVACDEQQLCNDDQLEGVTWMQGKHPPGAKQPLLLTLRLNRKPREDSAPTPATNSRENI